MANALRALTPNTTRPQDVPADVLVVGFTESGPEGSGTRLEASQLLALADAAQAVGFTGSSMATVMLPAPAGFKARAVLLVGLGDFTADLLEDAETSEAAHEALRRAAGTALRTVERRHSVALALPTTDDSAAEAVATGALLGAYTYDSYKSASATEPGALTMLTVEDHGAAVRNAGLIAQAVNRTRDLVNQPPADLYPESMAQEFATQAKERRLKVTVIDDKALRERGFGGLTGVGQGSPRGPRLVKLEYSPKKALKHMALVGKGITFDSGGLSLKPPASMAEMTSDMAGAAAVGQALFAIADLQLPVRVTAWLALAENMPGGSAQRPSDVLKMYGGTTVEVTNTDAEGRLVLADGLVAAQEEDPDLVIDVATLTGAQIVALGERTSGVMGTTGARNRVVLAGQAAGEPVWPMPLPEELRRGLDSHTADLKNAGPRPGGMLLAGVFLGEFVTSEQAWAHIDVAGPAFNGHGAWGYTPKEGTGVPVRTLIEVARGLSTTDAEE